VTVGLGSPRVVPSISFSNIASGSPFLPEICCSTEPAWGEHTVPLPWTFHRGVPASVRTDVKAGLALGCVLLSLWDVMGPLDPFATRYGR
jgi:hypothetical protein